MPPSKDDLRGLHWEHKTFGAEPRWTIEPDINNLKQTLQAIWPSKDIEVALFTQGALNKLYNVTVQDQPPLLLRVSLPVDPRHKTLSEVATIRWISQSATIPVPRILNYSSSRDSPVGFEWILMNRLEGTRLSDAWNHLDFCKKSELVKQIASFSAYLFKHQFAGIGNIYPQSLSVPLNNTPSTGRIVSMPFFWDGHIHLDINRGPYLSSSEWISTRLSLYESDCVSLLAKYSDQTELDSDAEDELDDATRTLKIIKRLRLLLNRVFPQQLPNEESTMLWHGDMSLSNILVNNRGRLSGVIDWECVSALPLWKACSYPNFLEGRTRAEKPDISRYQQGNRQQPSELYLEHLMDYELTSLRHVFLVEMKALEPEWLSVFNTSQVKRDFDLAVENCNSEVSARDIIKWADTIFDGPEEQCLWDMMYGP